MSHESKSNLINEDELRVALAPLRPDRDAFAAGVHARLESPEPTSKVRSIDDSSWHDESEFLRVAASVMPLPLAGGGTAMSAANSLGKASLLKLIGAAALPAISLLLAVGAAIFAAIQVRRVSSASPDLRANAQEAMKASRNWWKKYGRIAWLVFIVSLTSPFLGLAIPFILLYLLSAFAMVSLVTSLARKGMISRTAIGRCCAMGMILMAQVIDGTSSLVATIHLLDPALLPAVLWAGALVLLFLARPSGWWQLRRDQVLPKVFIGIMLPVVLCGIVGFNTQTLWRPVTTETIKRNVEAFDHAEFKSASWRQWSIPAVWLIDSDQQLDLAKPRRLLETEISGDQNPFVLGAAFEAKLFEDRDIIRLRDLGNAKQRLLHDLESHYRDQRILSIAQKAYVIRALVRLNQLNESERDFLASRLLVTLAQLEPKYNLLSDALAVTQLLELIERPVDYETFRPHVHEWLSAFQRHQNQWGSRVGGFAISSKLDFSDPTATADAVELMEYFGVPESVDITSLRSYLRPERTDHWLIRQSAIRVSTRQRLDRLPDVQAVSWWDYLRYERSLWMTILFVMLCIYVVMISHEDEISLKPEVYTSQEEGNG